MSYLEPLTDPSPDRLAAEPIRLGLIGTGFGASLHLSALRGNPDFQMMAICSRRPERARAAALDHGIPEHSADYRELVQDRDIDAFIVASPPHLHHSMVIAALEEGKHVLCEKPMARNLAEARDMQRIAERVGVVAMVNHQLRFLPVRTRIHELIGEGFIGEPHAASVVVHRSSLNDPMDRPWGWLMEQEKAGGMLGATGAHYVDALRWWFGEVKAVAGAVSTLVRQRRLPDSSVMAKVDADDNFAVILRFASGALGTIHVTATAGHEGDEEIRLSGSEGTLVIRDGQALGRPPRRLQPDRAAGAGPAGSGVCARGTLSRPANGVAPARLGEGDPGGDTAVAVIRRRREDAGADRRCRPFQSAGPLDRHQRHSLAHGGIGVVA